MSAEVGDARPECCGQDVTFRTGRARWGEYAGAAFLTIAAWTGAALAGMTAYMFMRSWLGEASAFAGPVAMAVSLALLWQWLKWLSRRLVFSITLGPTGVTFGGIPRLGLRYESVRLIRVSPRPHVGPDKEHWIEAGSGRRRRVLLKDRETVRACAAMLFDMSPDAIMIDERDEERFHPESLRLPESVAALGAFRRRRGKRHAAIAVALFLWWLCPVAMTVLALVGEAELDGEVVGGAVVLLVSWVAFAFLSAAEYRKASKIEKRLRDVAARTRSPDADAPSPTD